MSLNKTGGEMNRYRKIGLSIAALIIFTIITVYYICNILTSKSETVDDGIYFIKCDSYLGFLNDEEISIQLPCIQYYNNKKDRSLSNYNSISLICDENEIPVTSFIFQKGSETDLFTLYSLLIKINRVDIGLYKIKNIKIENQDGEFIYPIGDWVIEVRELVHNNDLNIGKRSAIESEFGSYTVELTNTLDNNIKISGMDFNLSDSYKINIKSFLDFDMSEVDPDLTLLPKHKKTFLFEFQNNKIDLQKKFIILRPFLVYKINNVEQLYLLPTCIYSPVIDYNYVINYIKEQQ